MMVYNIEKLKIQIKKRGRETLNTVVFDFRLHKAIGRQAFSP